MDTNGHEKNGSQLSVISYQLSVTMTSWGWLVVGPDSDLFFVFFRLLMVKKNISTMTDMKVLKNCRRSVGRG